MRKITLLLCAFFVLPAVAQEHFSGLATSKRVGILNGNMNPSEFANLGSRFEVQLFGLSVNASSNKVGFSDIVDGKDLEKLIFSGSEPVDFTTNAEIVLPGFAFKAFGWGFGISAGGHITANVIDVDSELGRAVIDNDLDPTTAAAIITKSGNQRVNATVWGEVGFSAARKIYANTNHRLNGGLTLKLLFPGSYANIGAGGFSGTIDYSSGNPVLRNGQANVNIAYSGNFADSFTDSSDYTSSLFGQLKGMATDIGFDYQWKPNGNSYKLKAGIAIKNMGSMTFKSDDNKSTNYELDMQAGDELNLSDFDNAESLSDIEEILNRPENDFFTETSETTDFKVKLPTVLNLYADYNIVSKLNVTLFLQQKMNKDDDNNQVASQNLFAITPRVNLAFFEAFLPVSFNEISGTQAGFGFRLSGFYLGSNSILTALGDGRQADAYFGYRFGFL